MEAHKTITLFLLTTYFLIESQPLVSAADQIDLSPPPIRGKSQHLVSATQEMLRANYFTFVTLINLSPPDLFHANLTFFMPNDRLLAGVTNISPDSVAGFLLRHSVPSPLPFDTLSLFPSGSVIPSSRQNYTLAITNRGRHAYLLNNVRIVSPNICSNVGSTIRCHGVDGVLSEGDATVTPVCRPPTNLTTTGPHRVGAPPSLPANNHNNAPNSSAADPSPGDDSGCSGRPVSLFVTCFVVLVSIACLVT